MPNTHGDTMGGGKLQIEIEKSREYQVAKVHCNRTKVRIYLYEYHVAFNRRISSATLAPN